MAITKRTSLDPNAAATAWATGMGRSGARWLKGIQNPRDLPNADPAKNTTNYLSGVAAAGPSFTAGISSPRYLARLEAGATAKQASFTGAGAAHQADYGSAAGKLFPIIQNALSTLPAKGPRGTNSARSTAFQEAMHAQRGNAKANR